MKRKDAIKNAVKKENQTFCRGCIAYEAGIKRGIAIADNNPLPSSVGNVVIQDLEDVELYKFKKDCLAAIDICNEEINKRQIY